MQKNINGSTNIAILKAKVVADLCLGKFFIDVTPTVFIGAGANSVLGAKISITNPYDVEVKQYPATGYDIVPPMTSVFQFNIPTQSANFQYGLYVVKVEMFDNNGKSYFVTENVNICQPNKEDSTKKFGDIGISIAGNCSRGEVVIQVGNPPVYNAKQFESKTQTLKIYYPSLSGLPSFTVTTNAFSLSLFEGEYVAKGDVCVTYHFEDEVYIKVPYKISKTQKILCLVEFCVVFDKMRQITDLLDGCKPEKRVEYSNILIDTIRLLQTIELGNKCGEDVTEYIDELENLLGVSCTSSASADTPVVQAAVLATNIVIQGCNVSTSPSGLTTVYTIDNFEFRTVTNIENNFLTVSSPTILNCTKTQQLSFNVALFYQSALKGQIVNDAEYNYWAGIVNNTLTAFPANLLVSLGVTLTAWNALSFRDKMILIMTKVDNCCGQQCTAVVSNMVVSSYGADLVIAWVNNAAVNSVDIYVDNVNVGKVLSPVDRYIIPGSMYKQIHSYKIISKCTNGTLGNTLTTDYTHVGCATIAPPSLSSANVVNAACPFNLNTLTATPATGFRVDWFNADTTNPINKVANPSAVTSGTYYAFMIETATNCQSVSSKTVVNCAVAGNCTEPLSMLVQKSTGNKSLVTFNSAMSAPTSYLVKRRLASDPDVTGSYTNIGTPLFNSGTNNWQIVDENVASNIIYVYKAESQCADGSRPSSFFTFANITCPIITKTSTVNSISYSFTHVGGSVNKYIVELYDSTGVTLIDSRIHIPAFASPVIGTFTGLGAGQQYVVKSKTFINAYQQDCYSEPVTTVANNFTVFLSDAAPIASTYELFKDNVSFASGLVSPGGTVQGFSSVIPFGLSNVRLALSGGVTFTVVTLNGLAANIYTTGTPSTATWNSIQSGSLAAFIINV